MELFGIQIDVTMAFIGGLVVGAVFTAVIGNIGRSRD